MTQQDTPARHNLTLTNRSLLQLEGVTEVQSFDDQVITLETQLGSLTIEGQELHIVQLALDSGCLTVEGNISALLYSDGSERPHGLFHRFGRR